MRQTLITLVLCGMAPLASATPSPEGRWEGRILIPGRELPVVIDLAPDTTGAWAGSIILPGLGIKGASLAKIVIKDTDVAFDIDAALASPTAGPAGFIGRISASGAMAGQMHQAGNVADLALTRVGPAEVEPPRRSTSVAREIEAEWLGSFDLGGYPRQVTLSLENRGAAGATARFVIVGKQVNDLPVNLVIQDGDFLRIESQATQVMFEGRIGQEAGEIRGSIELGSLELPLVLRRAPARAS